MGCQDFRDESWLTDPQNRATIIEPNLTGMVSLNEARRMGKMLRRALYTALKAREKAGNPEIDAIIMGTGVGCWDFSEKFLKDMSVHGEHGLHPSWFMQSTHNTIATTIAMSLKCHGYNMTYSQNSFSFDMALLDAFILITGGEAKNIIAGANDIVPAGEGEVSMSCLLTNTATGSLGRIIKVKVLENRSDAEIFSEIDPKTSLILTNDPSKEFLPIPMVNYEKYLGEGFSNSALGLYMAIEILRKQKFSPLWMVQGDVPPASINLVTVMHHVGSRCSIVEIAKS